MIAVTPAWFAPTVRLGSLRFIKTLDRIDYFFVPIPGPPLEVWCSVVIACYRSYPLPPADLLRYSLLHVMSPKGSREPVREALD